MASTGEAWRLGRRPALDGVRGIAILLVLLRHGHVPYIPTVGTVGVTMFFTLSGFLITALLLDELQCSRTISLSRFYMRRARRLFPALVACVAVVTPLSLFIGQHPVTPGQAGSALLYLTNWTSLDHPEGVLGHTWSLAIEEQFYLTWPLAMLVLVRWGRNAVLVGATLGAALSVALRLLLWDGGAGLWRVGFGTDTQADAILIGCALAAWMHGRPGRASRPVVAGAAMVGIGAVAAFSGVVAGFLFVPTVIALLTATIIACTATGQGARWLTFTPLVLVGQRSYGLYLWHYPVSVLLLDLGVRDWRILVVAMVALAWPLALLSWRFVETPFLTRRPLLVSEADVHEPSAVRVT